MCPQVELTQGGAACWVFLTCLEIVQACESYGSKGDREAYSLHMAVLWDYAKKKVGNKTTVLSTHGYISKLNKFLLLHLNSLYEILERCHKRDTGTVPVKQSGHQIDLSVPSWSDPMFE